MCSWIPPGQGLALVLDRELETVFDVLVREQRLLPHFLVRDVAQDESPHDGTDAGLGARALLQQSVCNPVATFGLLDVLLGLLDESVDLGLRQHVLAPGFLFVLAGSQLP